MGQEKLSIQNSILIGSVVIGLFVFAGLASSPKSEVQEAASVKTSTSSSLDGAEFLPENNSVLEADYILSGKEEKTQDKPIVLAVFAVNCSNAYATLENCTGKYRGSQTNYSVDVANQSVTMWTEGSAPDYSLLRNCSISNPNNWTCEYNDGSGTFGFNEGEYFPSRHSNIYAGSILHVDKETWESFPY